MAFRPEEQVVRGEIDNRMRGHVRGRIWFFDRETPVELELTGNAWRDVAGRRLEFVNPMPKPGDTSLLAEAQIGVVGDCTASRKVKVTEVPPEQITRLQEEQRPLPWHWSNSLYLEWFSEANGRVVIESTSFRLTITAGPTWEMSDFEEQQQREENAGTQAAFTERLGRPVDEVAPPAQGGLFDELDGLDAVEDVNDGDFADDDGIKPMTWTPNPPLTEAEAEAIQAESDLLADRIRARLEREGAEADFGKVLEEELERRRRERGETPLTPEQEAERAAWVEEMNRVAEEVMENPGSEVQATFEFKHPLAEHAFDVNVRLQRDTHERGWLPAGSSPESPVAELVNAVSVASAKLASALNGDIWPPEIEFCASRLVRLKRAREFLDDALLAAADCAEQNLVDGLWLAQVGQDIETIGHACDDLIAELRSRLDRAFE